MSQITVRTDSNKRRRSFDATGYVKRQRMAATKKYRIPGSLSTKFHKFIRSCATQFNQRLGMDLGAGFVYNGVNTGIFNLQFAFTLAGVSVYSNGTLLTTLAMPNYTELTALYDQYRIDWVDCQFMFSNNYSNVNTPNTVLPIMYLAKDYDDSNAANVTDLQQYATQQTWQLGQERGQGKHHVKIRPNVDVSLYQGLTTGYARGKPMLIDTGSPSVPHYGVKIAFDPILNGVAGTVVGYLSINFVYHLTMGHTK